MKMKLANTSAIVTGAASGLGAATAAGLAQRGATVYGLDLERAIGSATPPAGVTLIAADVTTEAEVSSALEQVTSGGLPLRVAVNCAGIAPSARILGKKGPHELELFRTVITVNLIGTFNVMRLAAEAMAATAEDENGQRGVIINTASVAAFEGQVGQIAYSASKGGVAAMTIVAARDLAQFGIRVNTIAPGIVDTPMLATISEEFRATLSASVPFPHRLAQPSEYAQLAEMIIEHDYLNGETIRMDGALRMPPR
jgi:NAD(P)-dependent dehydrogenase (short-subunit alcohol dehydrogenase family)